MGPGRHTRLAGKTDTRATVIPASHRETSSKCAGVWRNCNRVTQPPSVSGGGNDGATGIDSSILGGENEAESGSYVSRAGSTSFAP